ncbi:uncharacterized protein LOC105692396 isoform X2 [Athalia rosae]|uniref:uncharacterized protein LOC105692396 isoform X2 n=1 Tax=Athalia rosae TaxID=37344 RepID=UPI0020340D7D|nr:uncharacterized protein LOC105692396 isoform X2 [Athalia rosae]
MNNDKKVLSHVKEEFLAVHLDSTPQLTPTGKISYAKTRVYTQRYRSAWEQMPDFKGWLTSVPDQPTRAYCTYCKKNLHAHRLSLLKHTCTMKHQRCALMYQNESLALENNVLVTAEKDPIGIETPDDPDEIEETAENFKLQQSEGEDDDEEIEYVVERLDDENMDDEQCKDVEDMEYVEDEEEENLPVAKKIKVEKNEKNDRQDALAEAMAHVHGEYLNESGDPVNVELEMVVESVDSQPGQIQMVSIQSGAEIEEDQAAAIDALEHDENSGDYIQEEDKENEDQDAMENTSSCKSSMHGAESSEGASETEEPDHVEVHQVNVPVPAPRDYLIKPSMAQKVSAGTSNNSGTASMGTKKTIAVTSDGKIVSLDTPTMAGYAGGSRYVLNVAKGQASAVVLDSEKNHQGSEVQEQIKTGQQQQQATTGAATYSTASTSQPNTQKSVKPVVAKKPYISTHILDTSKGLPVGGLQISLYKLMDGRWTFLNESTSTADGRCADLLDTAKYRFTAGRYKLHYDVDKYFTLRRIETMYPFIEIIFDVKNPTEHYHLPVLLSPFGYTTYRGS